MKRFFLTGYYSKERTTGVSEIERIINQTGFIVDFKMFSDISLSLTIEIEERKVDRLCDDLQTIMSLNSFNKLNLNSESECVVFLNITFTKGTGDLKIEVPSIPG